MPSALNWASCPIALPVFCKAPFSSRIRPRIRRLQGEAQLVDGRADLVAIDEIVVHVPFSHSCFPFAVKGMSRWDADGSSERS